MDVDIRKAVFEDIAHYAREHDIQVEYKSDRLASYKLKAQYKHLGLAKNTQLPTWKSFDVKTCSGSFKFVMFFGISSF